MRLSKLFNRLLLSLLIFPLWVSAGGGEDWTFTVAPYLWVTGQEGKVATLPPLPPAEVDISFGDVIDNLDMALMGLAEARKGRFGISSEILYLSVSAGAELSGPEFSGADYEEDLLSATFAASYALTQDKDHLLDAVAGVRFWDLDNTLELKAGDFPDTTVSAQESWNDLFIGLKGKTRVNDHWYLTGWSYAAVAGDSDSFWDVFGGAGYEYSDTFSLVVGYRHQEVDYEKGDFLFDVELSGPIVGLVFRL